jgi:GTP-binding protein HflX
MTQFHFNFFNSSALFADFLDTFKSTLEESLAADLILLLVDCSERIENIRIKYSSCWDILDELKADRSKAFVILTKSDNHVKQKRVDEIAVPICKY